MPWQHVDLIEVRAWGERVGAIAPGGRGRYAFEYDPTWARSGREIAPILMPATRRRQIFEGAPGTTFEGLPPAIADSLPDRFGNQIIDAYLARQGLQTGQASVLDRLGYLGARGMGALEFLPDTAPHTPVPTGVDLLELILQARAAVHGTLADEDEAAHTLQRIINVGTSAGGARPKAIVNLDPATGELTSGHLLPRAGEQAWLLKFDGVGDDHLLGAGGGYGRIEFAYAAMAAAAGIRMPETRLLEVHGRAHFMTRRFDRDGATKVHMLSLNGLTGADFNLTGTHDYAQLFAAIQQLDLGPAALEEAFRRMVFNVAAANCDDHTKNHSFLYSPDAGWRLAPAYDVTFAYNSESAWVHQHLMGVNGRFAGITRADLLTAGERFGVRGMKALINRVLDAVADWPTFAADAGVPVEQIRAIAEQHTIGALVR